MNAEKETVQFRSRTSRLHKWRELVDKAHADLELPMASPDVIRWLNETKHVLNPFVIEKSFCSKTKVVFHFVAFILHL